MRLRSINQKISYNYQGILLKIKNSKIGMFNPKKIRELKKIEIKEKEKKQKMIQMLVVNRKNLKMF